MYYPTDCGSADNSDLIKICALYAQEVSKDDFSSLVVKNAQVLSNIACPRTKCVERDRYVFSIVLNWRKEIKVKIHRRHFCSFISPTQDRREIYIFHAGYARNRLSGKQIASRSIMQPARSGAAVLCAGIRFRLIKLRRVPFTYFLSRYREYQCRGDVNRISRGEEGRKGHGD